MGTIGRRVETTIKHLVDKDYENALIQLCIAIDATAKKRWKGYKPGKRIKSFLTEYETFIFQFATCATVVLHAGGKISIGAELPNILYKSVRCVLHHGDELSDYIVIQENGNVIGIDRGKFILNIGYIYGILFSILVDDENRNEKCDPNLFFFFNGNKIIFNECWGNLRKVENYTGYKKNF